MSISGLPIVFKKVRILLSVSKLNSVIMLLRRYNNEGVIMLLSRILEYSSKKVK